MLDKSQYFEARKMSDTENYEILVYIQEVFLTGRLPSSCDCNHIDIHFWVCLGGLY